MTKQVPFFIVVNKKEVRTLQDLRDNSHAQDIFSLYQHGVLTRWMHAIGEVDTADRLGSIDCDNLDGKGLLKAIFEAIGSKNELLESALYYIDFLTENNRHVSRLEKAIEDSSSFIEAYFSQYQDAKQSIIENCNDMYFMRNKLKLISELYPRIFSVDFNSSVELFCKEAPAAMLLLLSNRRIRSWCQKEGKDDEIRKKVIDIMSSREFQKFIPNASNEYTTDEFATVKTLVKTLSKDTDSSWDDIEPFIDKQFMILDIPARCKVRDLSTSKDVAKRIEFISGCKTFPIVNGIEYNSSGSQPLIYMEV